MEKRVLIYSVIFLVLGDLGQAYTINKLVQFNTQPTNLAAGFFFLATVILNGVYFFMVHYFGTKHQQLDEHLKQLQGK